MLDSADGQMSAAPTDREMMRPVGWEPQTRSAAGSDVLAQEQSRCVGTRLVRTVATNNHRILEPEDTSVIVFVD